MDQEQNPVNADQSTLDVLSQDDNTPDEKIVMEIQDEVPEPEEDLLAPDKDEETEDETKEKTSDKKEEEQEEEVLEDPETLAIPVPIKAISSKYPNLFKEFPYLKIAYHRDQQYTELFGTVEDAREVAQRSSTLGKFEQQLSEGKTEELLKTVKDNDPDAFNEIVDNYLPTLQKIDNNAYLHVLSNVIKQTIVAIAHAGHQTQNDDFLNAAAIINKFIFNTDQLAPYEKFNKNPKQPNDQASKFQDERKQWFTERVTTAQTDLQTKADNALKSTISNNIDPNNKMTDYVKQNAVRDAVQNLNNVLRNDPYFQKIMQNLWIKAANENLSSASLNSILAAYKSKAKTVLPDVIRNARSVALRGLANDKTNNDSEESKKGPIKGRATPSNNGGQKVDTLKRGEKTLDFLMRD